MPSLDTNCGIIFSIIHPRSGPRQETFLGTFEFWDRGCPAARHAMFATDLDLAVNRALGASLPMGLGTEPIAAGGRVSVRRDPFSAPSG